MSIVERPSTVPALDDKLLYLGNGVMSRLVRAHDWSATPLGPMEQWPASLRVAVGICLNSRFPMFVWWGPELINIYNDAYIPVLGKRHPGALGRSAPAVWGEIWPVVGPQADAVMHRRESTWNERVLLVMERYGYSEETWFTWSYSPIADETGNIGGLFCACTEETQRVLAERERDRFESALRNSEQRYRSFISLSSEGIWRFELDAPVPTDLPEEEQMGLMFRHAYLAECNDAMARMYGFGCAEEIVGRRLSHFHDASDPRSAAFLRAFVRNGYRLTDAESREADRSGRVRVFLNSFVGLVEDGNLRRAWGTQRDVTEERRAQEALRGSEQQLRALVEQSSAGIGVLEPDGRFRFANRRLCELVGYSQEELLGLRMQDITHPDDVQVNLDLIRRSAADGEAYEIEKRYVRKDGTVVWAGISSRVLRDEQGVPRSVVGIVIDITQRKQAEAERARLIGELEAERARLAEVFHRSPSFMAVVRGPAHVFELANERYYQLVGQRDLIGRSVTEALPEVRGQGFFELLDRVYATGEPFVGKEMSVLLQRAPGLPPEERIVEFVYQPLRDAGGAVSGIFAHGVDLSERKAAEAALRDSEARLAAILNNTPAMVYVVDAQDRFRFINRQFESVFGLTNRNATGRSLYEVFPRDIAGQFAANNRRVLAGHSTVESEEVVPQPDGAHTYISVKVPLFDGEGHAYAICGISTDITDRKHAEAERERLLAQFQAQHERTSEILESISDAFYAVDAQFRFTYVNRRAEELWGRRREELIGRHYWTEFPMAVGSESHRMHLAVMSSRRAAHYEAVSPVIGRWVEVSIYPEAGGGGLSCYFRDISDRKHAEMAMRESAERLELALAIAQMGTFEIDLASDAVTVNDAGRAIYGWGSDEALTFARVQEQFHPEDRGGVMQRVDDALRPGGAGEFEVEQRIVRRDGAVRWIRVRGRGVYEPDRGDSGGDGGGGGGGRERRAARCVGTYLDITEQREAEHQREQLLLAERAARAEAERASEAKSEFLATLSHELRTPLTPVLLTVSLMESHPGLPDDLREDVTTIRRNVELESRLISDLLDLTRVASGKLQLDLHDIDLHLVVRSAVDICQRQASARLVLDLRAGRHTVRGDSTRLQQIFWNLVNNAMKFTGSEGTITVRSSDAADGGRVRVEVIDTGVGIDPGVLPRLFNAFEQGEVRAARQQAGLGLGLAISRRLAEAHGGTITAFSAGRGRGSTFTVELPVVDRTTPAPASARPASPPERARRPLRILLVEDHEPTLGVMAKLLRALGHTVTAVTSVAAAMTAAGQEDFELIISDLGLPDGSGLDVMRQLRDEYAGRAIALTGYGMESDIAASRDAGFAEHLTKPVDLAALEAAIGRVVPPA